VIYALRLRPELVDDTHAAYAWYESAATGLGHEFLRAYFVAVAAAHRYPLAHQKVYQDFRRVLLGRFPYGLYYRLERRTVIIFLLSHGSLDPVRIRRTLRDRKTNSD